MANYHNINSSNTYLAVDEDGQECIFQTEPERDSNGKENFWQTTNVDARIDLPKGTIKKLTGKTITWKNKPLIYY